MKLDIQKWDTRRKEVETTIKELKSKQRESFQPRWRGGLDDWELNKLKRAATDLYMLRAGLRGKKHCEDQTDDFVQQQLEHFVAKEPETVAIAAA